MCRTPLIAALLLLALALAPAAGAAMAPLDPDGAPPLRAALETCETGSLPAQRVATFTGSMPALVGVDRMRMRFDLERRRPGERRWRRLRGAVGFGVWERSLPGRAGFVFHKRVDSLLVPAAYRVLVRFRWLRASGSEVDRATLRSPACRQPDLRPNLVSGALTAVADAQPGLAVYTLVVRNAGRSPAAAFSVRVGTGSAEVAELAPGERRQVVVTAPVCASGASVLTRVDADRRIDESDESANVRRHRCPLDGDRASGSPATVDTLVAP